MRSFGSFVNLRGRGGGVAARGEGVRSGSEEMRKFEFRGVSVTFDEMEVRKVMMRGGKWLSKGWPLSCVTVCSLLVFWALMESLSDFSFLSMFRAGREDDAALQNLDEISMALLKLGLPLSAYALSMQQNRAQSLLSPTVVDPSPGFGPADQTAQGARFPVQQVGDNGVPHSSDSTTESWTGKEKLSGSEVSIYRVGSTYKYAQQLWVLKNVCYNGSHLIRLQSEACRDPEDAAPQGLLMPISCAKVHLYARRLALLGKETGIPTAERLPSWIIARDRIVWRNETVAVLNLDRHTTDPARFLQKVNMLLLLNNASIAAFLDRVHAFMFMSHHRVVKILRHQGGVDGEDRLHRTYLSTILSRALSMDEAEVADIVVGGGGGGRRKAAAGNEKLQLNDPFVAATEGNPLCFRKVVLPGTLKGSCWPGGEVVADIVRGHLTERFDTKSVTRSSNNWPRLVSILGNNARKVLSSSSEEGFRALLNKKTLGLEVHFRDLNALDFKQQFDALQMADIVTGFYGPELILPATFCRKMTILLEIMPHKVQDRVHEMQALDSGLIYMAHLCQEGAWQDNDSIFRNHSASACMANSKCKLHYATVRKVQLTSKDLYQLQKMISLARLITSEISAQKLAERRNTHDASLLLVQNLMGGQANCRSFVPTQVPSASCGTNWISFTSESRGPFTCCY